MICVGVVSGDGALLLVCGGQPVALAIAWLFWDGVFLKVISLLYLSVHASLYPQNFYLQNVFTSFLF